MWLLTGSGRDCKPSTVGFAASAAGLGLSNESTPWLMNTADNMGRAILRINMVGEFPGYPAHKPASCRSRARVECVRALLIVDVQNDFCEGGSLPVTGGHDVARAISDYLSKDRGYHHIVAAKDFHIDPGDHFSQRPDLASSWPPHCRAGSAGADFAPDLDMPL